LRKHCWIIGRCTDIPPWWIMRWYRCLGAFAPGLLQRCSGR